jgi:hypothetical protein
MQPSFALRRARRARLHAARALAIANPRLPALTLVPSRAQSGRFTGGQESTSARPPLTGGVRGTLGEGAGAASTATERRGTPGHVTKKAAAAQLAGHDGGAAEHILAASRAADSEYIGEATEGIPVSAAGRVLAAERSRLDAVAAAPGGEVVTRAERLSAGTAGDPALIAEANRRAASEVIGDATEELPGGAATGAVLSRLHPPGQQPLERAPPWTPTSR